MDPILVKLEQWIVRPVYLLTDVLARLIAYTFGVAFVTSISGFIIAGYVALFLYSVVDLAGSGTGDNFLLIFGALIPAIYLFGYYPHFGALFPLGLRCFNRSLTIINRHIVKNEIALPTDEDDARGLLLALEKLPTANVRAALIYPSVILVTVTFEEYVLGWPKNALYLFIGISGAILIYAYLTYLIAELLTGRTRAELKRLLTAANIAYENRVVFSLRKKQINVIFIVLVAMAQLLVMFFGGGTVLKGWLIPMLYIVMTATIITVILLLNTIGIENALAEIEAAATDLGGGGAGHLHQSSLDREFVDLAAGIRLAATEVQGMRAELEHRVRERTEELNAALAELQSKDRAIQAELAIASDIQKGILPPTPVHINGLHITAHYQSREKVGGDIFDIYPLKIGDEKSLAILMADVSGHGIPAAFVTALSKIGFADAVRNNRRPSEILNHLNKMLIDTVKTQEYLTAFLLVIKPNYDVIYSNASHRKAIVLRKNERRFEEWDTEGLFVGIIDEASYEDKTSHLHQGDRIFLYTDGLAEARNPIDGEFGEERLNKMLLDTLDFPLEEARERIIRQWTHFVGPGQINDDVAFMLIELDPRSADLTQSRERAKMFFLRNQTEEGIRELEKVARGSLERDPEIISLLARAHFQQKNYRRTIEILKNNIEFTAEHLGNLYRLAAAYYYTREYERALEFSGRALAIKGDSRRALMIRGLTLKELKRAAEARETWEKLLQIDPEHPTAKRELEKSSE